MSTPQTLIQTPNPSYPHGQPASWDQVATLWRNPAPTYQQQPQAWAQPTFAPQAYAAQLAALPTSDDRTIAALGHWGTLFAGWLAPVIALLANGGRSEFVRRHAVAGINFHISMFIWVFIAGMASLVLIGLPFLLGLAIYLIVGPIQAGLAANRGEDFRYAMTIDFLR